jgi:hypothetical protein
MHIGSVYKNYGLELEAKMSIFEAIGMAWVIFTSALATVGVLYLAFLGLKVHLKQQQGNGSNVLTEVKEMFKIAR